MNAADVLAYTCDGAVYCPDCLGDDESNPEIGAWFADDEDSLIGSTCDGCSACYTDDGWTGHDDAVNRTIYRWSRCQHCNDQRPWSIGASHTTQARKQSRQRTLVCRDCRKPSVRF